MITWTCKSFTQLSPAELYNILKLRNEIFVVEQDCVYQDCDDKDQEAWHLTGWQQNRLVAYSRLLPPGLVYEDPSIGRVLTSLTVRRTRVGRELMQRSIDKIYELFGKRPLLIGAQLYLKNFYESFGFVQAGEPYPEDGIEHIKMKLN
ncbi:MAG: GNAT family N-acetyltransferase [Chitinophagaceae bacterium]|nr:GNAT family N-acetyltransferase [Chitinophagaceae bacterium]